MRESGKESGQAREQRSGQQQRGGGGERKLLFLGLLGLVEAVYGSLLILC